MSNTAYGQRKKRNKTEEATPKKGGNKEKIDFLFIGASTEYVKGEVDAALNMYKEILKLDSKHHASMYNIGKLALEKGDYQTAEKYARENDPEIARLEELTIQIERDQKTRDERSR